MNVIRKMRVDTVVMPLVRLMAHADLSWADREEVSAAIAVCIRHFNDMETERQHLDQQGAQQQVAAPAKRSRKPKVDHSDLSAPWQPDGSTSNEEQK